MGRTDHPQRVGECNTTFQVSNQVLSLVEKDMQKLIVREPEQSCSVRDIINHFGDKGIHSWVVGGAARDWLEGRPCKDMDITIHESFRTIKRQLTKGFNKGRIFGENKNFGLVQWGSIDAKLDFNMLRKLTKILPLLPLHSQRHYPTNSLLDDALLRDFTINSVYYSPSSHQFIDPTGRGMKAISNRILEFSCPLAIIEISPYLCLRAIKFMTLDFTPNQEVIRLLRFRLEDDIVKIGPKGLAIWFWKQMSGRSTQSFQLIASDFIKNPQSRRAIADAIENMELVAASKFIEHTHSPLELYLLRIRNKLRPLF